MRCYEIVTRDAAGQKVALISHSYRRRWLVMGWVQPFGSVRCSRLRDARMVASDVWGAVAFDAARPYGEVLGL